MLQFLIRIDSKSGDCHQPWYLVLYARKAVKFDMATGTLSEVCERSSEDIADRKSFPRIRKDTGNKSSNSNHIVASLPRPWPRVFLHEHPQSPYLWSRCIWRLKESIAAMSSLPSPCQALEVDFPLEIIAALAKTRHGPDKKAPITKTTAFTFFRLGKKAEHEFDISGTLVKTLYVCIVVIRPSVRLIN
jgi:hypothetical protein